MITIKKLISDKTLSKSLKREETKYDRLDLCLNSYDPYSNKDKGDLCNLFDGLLDGFMNQSVGMLNGLIGQALLRALNINKDFLNIVKLLIKDIDKGIVAYTKIEELLTECLTDESLIPIKTRQANSIVKAQYRINSVSLNLLRVKSLVIPNLFTITQLLESEDLALRRIDVTTERLASSNSFSTSTLLKSLDLSEDEHNTKGLGCIRTVIMFVKGRKQFLQNSLSNIILQYLDQNNVANELSNKSKRSIHDYSMQLSDMTSNEFCQVTNRTKASIQSTKENIVKSSRSVVNNRITNNLLGGT